MLHPAETEEIRRVFATYAETWNANDMESWGQLFTDDVDYVNRNGGWWRDNANNVAGHVAIHDVVKRRGVPMDFQVTVESIELLAPGVALTHVTTSWPGLDSGDELGPRTSEGIITAVLVRRGGSWLVRAFHNTLRVEESGR